MNEAIYGFLGVIVGSLIPWIKEALHENHLQKKHSIYLAVQVVCVLDEFVQKCSEIVGDDGTYMGQAARRDENGQEYYEPQVSLPKPLTYPSDVDWKSIDSELMYRLLSLPNNIKNTNRAIEFSYEIASPPDFEEAFEAREKGYVTLGLEALKLAEELRDTYKMPKKNYNDWNPAQYILDKKKKIEESQKK